MKLFLDSQKSKGDLKICLLLFILILLIVSQVKSQIPKDYYYKELYYDSCHVNSIVQNEFPNIGNSYFIITYPMTGATTSWGNQLYVTYERIKNRKENIVLIISNEGGIRHKDIENYLIKILHIPRDSLSKIYILWDTKLYDCIQNNRDLVRLIYVFRNHIYFDQAQKFNNQGIKNLPEEVIHFSNIESIKLNDIDNYFIKKSDPLIGFNTNKIFLLGDVSNTLFEINTLTGDVKPIIEIEKMFKPYDLYNKYILKYSANEKYELAKKRDKKIRMENRQTIKLSKVIFQNNTLYGFISIEVTEVLKKDRKFVNDEAKEMEYLKGTESLNVYNFMLIANIDSINEYKIFPIQNLKTEDDFAGFDMGFYVNDSLIYTTVTRYPSPKKEKNHIAIFKIEEDSINFISYDKPSTKEDDFLGYNNIKDFYLKFNEQLYYSYSCINGLFLIGRNKEQSSYVGDGRKPYSEQVYKQYADEQIEEKINIDIHEIGVINNSNYLIFFYKYKDNFICELKNRMLKTIDVVELKEYSFFKDYISDKYLDNLLVWNNKVYYLSLNNDELILKSTKILIE